MKREESDSIRQAVQEAVARRGLMRKDAVPAMRATQEGHAKEYIAPLQRAPYLRLVN